MVSMDELSASTSETVGKSTSLPKSHSPYTLLQSLFLEKQHPFERTDLHRNSSVEFFVFEDDDNSSYTVSCIERNCTVIQNLLAESDKQTQPKRKCSMRAVGYEVAEI